MNFSEVLAELPSFTVAERQRLVRIALELDDSALSSEDEILVEHRLVAHRRDPKSALSLEEMKARLHNRVGK